MHIWEDNIKMHHRKTGREDVNRNEVPQDRVQWRAIMGKAISCRDP
jgi:hypothetical protein